MLTPLGKRIRKARLDRGQASLKEMASFLGVSSSYLSSIEHGRRPISKKILNGIIKFFDEQETRDSEWEQLADLSQPQLTLNLADDREVKYVFAKSYDSFSESKKQEIRRAVLGPDEE